ncbi:MAG: hypothetical protein LBV47_03075 [Bacteroidales bacterium]|jgi:hypothetical protein|nr:hypothetical protein [Bacteroidales bacterium]
MKLTLKQIVILLSFMSVPFMNMAQIADNSETAATSLRKWVQFDGAIKTKFEMSTDGGVMRFNVRNSRLGLRGDIGEYVSYRIQADLSNEGVFQPLDLFGTLKPAKGVSINFGQTSIPFDNQYIITPAEMMFANRAFVGKYFTPGSRDIGTVVKYSFPTKAFPLEGELGMFNGGKINNPQWTDNPSYAARLIAGSMDGFRTSAKVYQYNGEIVEMLLWGADVHYANERLRVEAEVMNRTAHTTSRDLFGTYIQGTYMFDIKNGKMFHNLSPAFRWDAMGYDVTDAGFDVNRLTFGINFGLDMKPFSSTLRINYEQYFVGNDNFAEFNNRDPHVSDNKVTLELLLRF